jgi:peptidoglycan/LPS O-acetylase OafA/YrhL
MKKKYFNTLQILRAVAFLTIFLSHCLVVDGAFSRWGVAVFFVLSGFLNAVHGYDKDLDCSAKGSANYGVKKVKKLFPLHVVMVLIAFVLYTVSNASVFIAELPKSIVVAGLKLIANIFLITDWLPSEGVTNAIFSEYNIVTWYLSASLLFYICTPLLLRALKTLFSGKKANKAILKMLAAILIIYVLVILENLLFLNILGLDRVFWYAYENPLSRIGDYVIGLILGCLYSYRADASAESDEQDDVQNKVAIPCALVIVSTLLSILLLYVGIAVFTDTQKWIISTGFYYTVPAAGFVIGLAFLESYIKEKVWDNVAIKRIIHFGTLSAYTYLIHVPVINFVHAIYKRLAVVNVYIWGAISMIITVVIAMEVYENGKAKKVK